MDKNPQFPCGCDNRYDDSRYDDRCDCGCERHNCPKPCPKPEPPCPPPRPQGRFLMQRIVGMGQSQRRGCFEVCISVPCDAKEPLTLVEVMCSGALPTWEDMPCAERFTRLIRVCIPIVCQVRDACGRMFATSATIFENVRVRMNPHENCCPQLFVQAAVRLCGKAQKCSCACFEAQLEVKVEAFAVCASAMGGPMPGPSCRFDDRPLYPQPCCDKQRFW